MNDTRERILETAERLFAERGYSATSLRTVITEANVNQAAVHYYFRSKEALLEAVFLRRMEPANRERLEMLDRFEEAAGRRGPELEDVIRAFVVPAFRATYDPAKGGRVFRALLGRLYAEGDMLPKLAAAHLVPLLSRFAVALARAMPDLVEDELFWRVQFAMGATGQAMRGTGDWEVFDRARQNLPDSEAILERLVAFLCAGFRAPVRVLARTGAAGPSTSTTTVSQEI
jgi:AcrR family transcriptional regulator